MYFLQIMDIWAQTSSSIYYSPISNFTFKLNNNQQFSLFQNKGCIFALTVNFQLLTKSYIIVTHQLTTSQIACVDALCLFFFLDRLFACMLPRAAQTGLATQTANKNQNASNAKIFCHPFSTKCCIPMQIFVCWFFVVVVFFKGKLQQ